MKKLNYEKIITEAKRTETSPHLIVKRLLNYRKAGSMEPMCKSCKSLNSATIDRMAGTAQCETIGEGFDGYATINLKYTCNAHKRN